MLQLVLKICANTWIEPWHRGLLMVKQYTSHQIQIKLQLVPPNFLDPQAVSEESTAAVLERVGIDYVRRLWLQAVQSEGFGSLCRARPA